MDNFKLCIVIPCYNEEKRLNGSAFLNYSASHPDIHFLFVNDGSSDGTLNLLQQLCAGQSRMQLLDCPQNAGKALAVRAGCLRAAEQDFTHIGYWDADLATPLNEIDNFVTALKQHTRMKVIMGSRLMRLGASINRKFTRHLIGRFFATLASIILNLKVYDTQCGAKIFTRQLVLDIFRDKFVSYWIFDVELLFRIKNTTDYQKAPDCILELPLYSWDDKSGSKLKWIDFLKAPLELWHIFRHYRM